MLRMYVETPFSMKDGIRYLVEDWGTDKFMVTPQKVKVFEVDGKEYEDWEGIDEFTVPASRSIGELFADLLEYELKAKIGW